MVAALQRFWCEAVELLPLRWAFGRREETGPAMVGEYEADYGPIPSDELQKGDPEMDALLARSRVVSVKSGL